MNGYIMNRTTTWLHALKRSIRPGGKVQLDELYKQYGAKNKLKRGTDFVEWLRKIKLTDADRWYIVLEDEDMQDDVSDLSKDELDELKVELPVDPKTDESHYDPKPKVMTIADVVGLSVRNARTVLPQISDTKLLKYALQESSVRAGKDSLCRELRRRIKQLEVARGY